MTLLEAINTALRSTGETGVAAINSAHPQISTVLAEIDLHSKRIQRRGWWFNQGTRTLTPVAGEIDTSAYDKVIPVQRGLNYYPIGNVLIDGETGLAVDEAVEANVRWIYPTTEQGFIDMPASVTDYIAASAALGYASNYSADELQLNKLAANVTTARTEANADNIRYSRVNLYASGSAGMALLNSWGARYGRYR